MQPRGHIVADDAPRMLIVITQIPQRPRYDPITGDSFISAWRECVTVSVMPLFCLCLVRNSFDGLEECVGCLRVVCWLIGSTDQLFEAWPVSVLADLRRTILGANIIVLEDAIRRDPERLHEVLGQLHGVLECFFVVVTLIDAHLDGDRVQVIASAVCAEKVVAAVVPAHMIGSAVVRQALIDGMVIHCVMP